MIEIDHPLSGKAAVVVVAGGIGKRFGADTPKQFIELQGKPVIYYCLDFFNSLDEISAIIPVVHPDWVNQMWEWVREWHIDKVLDIAVGGETRRDSVHNGIRVIAGAGFPVVLVHDAARPFPPKKETIEAIKTAENGTAAILALDATDTIKMVDENNNIQKTIDRKTIRLAQTPQVFPLRKLADSLDKIENSSVEFTDEASVFEYMGYPVKTISSPSANIKITKPEDMRLAEIILKNRE